MITVLFEGRRGPEGGEEGERKTKKGRVLAGERERISAGKGMDEDSY